MEDEGSRVIIGATWIPAFARFSATSTVDRDLSMAPDLDRDLVPYLSQRGVAGARAEGARRRRPAHSRGIRCVAGCALSRRGRGDPGNCRGARRTLEGLCAAHA